MKRFLLLTLVAVALLAPALALAVQTPSAPVVNGRFVATGSGTAPTLTNCSGNTGIAGNDTAGRITLTAVTQACTVNFNEAFTTAPTCIAVNETAPGTARASGFVSQVAPTTTTVVITLEAEPGPTDAIAYVCIGR